MNFDKFFDPSANKDGFRFQNTKTPKHQTNQNTKQTK
jgi:hypothetical protein